jgi:pantothenate kinase
VTLLRRLKSEPGVIYAPAYSRTLHEPIAGSIAVSPEHRLVVVEGNYLLLESAGWTDVAGQFDQMWYIDTPLEVRRQRLIDRQVIGGRSRADAEAWVAAVDEPNARLVEASATRASRRTAG